MASSTVVSLSERIEVAKILQEDFELLEKQQLEIGRQQAELSRKQIDLALKCGAVVSAIAKIIGEYK